MSGYEKEVPHVSRYWLATLLALLCGVLLVIIDSHSRLPQFPAAWVIGFALLLGIVSPKPIVRWATVLCVALALGALLRIPTVNTYLQGLRWLHGWAQALVAVKPYQSPSISLLVPFVPALAAAYLGRRLRQFLSLLDQWSRWPSPEGDQNARGL